MRRYFLWKTWHLVYIALQWHTSSNHTLVKFHLLHHHTDSGKYSKKLIYILQQKLLYLHISTASIIIE